MALFTNKEQRIQDLTNRLNFWLSKEGDFAARQAEVIKRCLSELSQ